MLTSFCLEPKTALVGVESVTAYLTHTHTNTNIPTTTKIIYYGKYSLGTLKNTQLLIKLADDLHGNFLSFLPLFIHLFLFGLQVTW